MAKAIQVFERLLQLQYRLDTGHPDESPQIFEDINDSMEELQSLTGLTSDQIQDALNAAYEAYLREQNEL